MEKTKTNREKFVVCVNNDEHPASLEKRKIYTVLPDREAEKHDLIRVVDESGEDYLYPSSYFVPVSLSSQLRQALRAS